VEAAGMKTAVIVLSTFPADQDPRLLATALVEERLVACVNVLPPMTSIYRWAGKIEVATEHQLVMKTTAARLNALKTRIAALHPYDVPEILVFLADGGADAYLEWLAASTSKA
jgi:periplasmic divalent cation tolerance protein